MFHYNTIRGEQEEHTSMMNTIEFRDSSSPSTSQRAKTGT